jgi:hypothetical protein
MLTDDRAAHEHGRLPPAQALAGVDEAGAGGSGSPPITAMMIRCRSSLPKAH